MKKKIVLGTVTVLACIMLTGCAHTKHEWVEATCTEPRTCTVGGETEGEPLGHTWVEANYQEPKTCSVCGATEGEPLTGYFEEMDMPINVELGVTYDYVTACSEDSSKKTVAHLTLSNYRVFESDETHAAEEGYEWRSVHVDIVFDDENANYYGVTFLDIVEDYYSFLEWQNSMYRDEYGVSRGTINYYGEEAECALYWENSAWSEWVDDTITYEEDIYVQVPVGYDGLVISFSDYGESYYDDNSLFFRMD